MQCIEKTKHPMPSLHRELVLLHSLIFVQYNTIIIIISIGLLSILLLHWYTCIIWSMCTPGNHLHCRLSVPCLPRMCDMVAIITSWGVKIWVNLIVPRLVSANTREVICQVWLSERPCMLHWLASQTKRGISEHLLYVHCMCYNVYAPFTCTRMHGPLQSGSNL